jgi:uncharacterized protein YceK
MRSWCLVFIVMAASGCTSVAQLTNLADPSCSATFQTQLASVLVQEGETAETAQALAQSTDLALSSGRVGPRPFLVSSPKGTDYSFFIQPKKSGCFLRLYGRQRGFTSYTNNLTYIATRPLSGCACSQ